MTAERYIELVIGCMPPGTPSRDQIAMELKGHIAERLQHGQSLDEVLAKLGDPAALAASYLSALPLVSASFGARALAKLLDVVLVMAFVAPVAWFVWRTAPLLSFFVILGIVLAVPIYTIVMEFTRGHTMGKRAMGLRVVQESGLRLTLGRAIVRQLPILLNVFWIDMWFVLFTERKQRAFELLSKTRVVQTSPVEAPIVSAVAMAMLMLCASTSLFAQPVDIGPPPGRLIDIGPDPSTSLRAGRTLHLNCTGSGSPTVVLEAGASSFAIDWALVQPELSKTHRVCSYDRAGHGWSDPGASGGAGPVSDLHALLRAAGEKPPYVLAGASRGGLYVRLYALQYPEEVAGLVLVDPATEERLFVFFRGKPVDIASLTVDEFRETISPGTVKVPRRSPQTGTPFDRLPPALYETRIALERRLIESVPETILYEARVKSAEEEHGLLARLRAATLANDHPLGDRPIVVLTRGVDSTPAVHEVHARLARLSTNGRHTIVKDAGHEIHLFQPAAVIEAIREVLSKSKR